MALSIATIRKPKEKKGRGRPVGSANKENIGTKCGVLVLQRRKELNLSMDRLAESSQTAKSAISGFENGAHLSEDAVYRIAKSLEMPAVRTMLLALSEKTKNADMRADLEKILKSGKLA